MTHISIRLPWHDRGWDGCICNKPRQNCYCKGNFSINAEKIRMEKDDTLEESLKGMPLDDSMQYRPPCSESINIFGEHPVKHTFYPREFIQNTSPKTVEIPANCGGTWPFEGMWDRDTGAALPASERRENARIFSESVEKAGEAGFAFYYCNYDNPVSGDDKRYALTGIARIKKVHPFMEWNDIPKNMEEKFGNFIWSRLVENNPLERIRLPYQEYLDMGKDVKSISIFADDDISRSFKYGAHHVSDDDAISLIDRTIASVTNILDEKFLDADLLLKWEKNLEWLHNIRKECWISRGLYPGLAPVLRYLGVERPEEFIRTRLTNLPKEKIKDYFFDRFEGKEEIGPLADKPIKHAAERYKAMINSGNESQQLKALLCRDRFPFFALEDDQIKNILDDHRGIYCVTSALQTIYENPYNIVEEYTGSDENDRINFDKIDHGMLPAEVLPAEDLGDIERIRLDDWRRLRALMFTMLQKASSKGHTFLEWTDLSEKVNKWHAINDKGGNVFNFDLTTWEQYKTEFEPKIVEDRADGIMSVYLKKLHEAERTLSKEFRSLINDNGITSAGINWQDIINNDKSLKMEEQTKEQMDALEKLYASRLSVLAGSAGTGKTTVIRSLIKGIKEKEPRHDFLLLAPTGKASLILKNRINDPSVPVMTIHSFLMKNNWININNFTLKNKGNKIQKNTVIVDESSMIDTLLFCTMIKAIDISNVERLIFVGDYNQLPPIGPGKVYYDLMQHLKADNKNSRKHLAELTYNWRQVNGSKASCLADHYSRSTQKADEEIFSEIEGGNYEITNKANDSDLVIDYWNDEDDLLHKLPDVIEYAVSRLINNNQAPLGDNYNAVHGIPSSREKNIGLVQKLKFQNDSSIDAINVISPYRHTSSGVDNLNIELQKILRGKENVDKYSKYHYVFYDKVLQVKNNHYTAYDFNQRRNVETDETYIPNGTFGFVSPNQNRDFIIKFPPNYENLSYYLTKKQVDEMLELGYATSVHKAQGSQFDVTIMIIPEETEFLSREMLYTALTRSRKCLVLLVQKDISLLKSRLWIGNSDIVKRNSSLFSKSHGIPPTEFVKYMPEKLIYEALPELFVRSRDEVAISKALAEAGIGFYYEKVLPAKDGKSFKLPDFTFKHNRKEYYWEHKGMLSNFDYSQRDEKKTRWYTENGYQDKLIETPIGDRSMEESIKYVFENILGI